MYLSLQYNIDLLYIISTLSALQLSLNLHKKLNHTQTINSLPKKMIIKVFNKQGDIEAGHSFKQKQIILGRNPKVYNCVPIDSQTVSRSHLKITVKNDKIRIQDLNSSNGTFVNGEQIPKDQKVTIQKNDKITLGQYENYIQVCVRQSQTKQKSESSSQQSQNQRQRSRQKEKKKGSQIHIAQSTLKMLRSMTADKKSKAEKIKFLKLMGYPQAQESWDQIDQMIKAKKTYFLSNANKKATQQLQKQFSQSRSGHQKRGLGR